MRSSTPWWPGCQRRGVSRRPSCRTPRFTCHASAGVAFPRSGLPSVPRAAKGLVRCSVVQGNVKQRHPSGTVSSDVRAARFGCLAITRRPSSAVSPRALPCLPTFSPGTACLHVRIQCEGDPCASSRAKLGRLCVQADVTDGSCPFAEGPRGWLLCVYQ
jgi:hypothetical protein